MMTEPTRLLDDPSIAASLRADLAQAKAAGLAGFDAAAGAASLKAAIAAQTGSVAAVSAAASAGVNKGLVLGLIGVVSAGAVAWLAFGSPEPADAVVPPPVAAVEGTPVLDPPPQPKVEPPAMIVVAEPEAPAEPVVLPERQVEPEVSEPEPPVRVRTDRNKPPKPVASDDYLREAKLIAEARRTMKRDPERALDLLEDANTSFPRGLLREEREALTILSLDRLGRSNEAETRATQFLEKHGEGPYADAVRQVLD